MPIHGAVIMLPRDLLAERAAHRLDQMLAGGALEEVAALLARNLPADRPVLRAIGVRDLAGVLTGDVPLEQAHAAILAATRAYQKRQITWARNRQRGWAKLEPDQIDDLTHLPCLQID